MRDLKTRVQLILGTSTIAAWGLARHYFDRPGRSTNVTDFALGMMLGVGAGLLILVVWRSSRQRYS